MQEELVGNWAHESHLSVEMLGSLRDLNHRFLDLAATGRCGRPAGLAAQVEPLSAQQRAAAADCPYALFDLRFADDAHWRARLQSAVRYRVADESSGDDDKVRFARLALFFAWHVASRAGMAAQLLLGMNAATVTALRRATVNTLPALVVSETPNLAARWSHCGAYWSALTAAAAHADAGALRRVQLYGLQLAAAARLPNSSSGPWSQVPMRGEIPGWSEMPLQGELPLRAGPREV